MQRNSTLAEDRENIESAIRQPEQGAAGYDRRKSLEGRLVVVKAGGDVLDSRRDELLDEINAVREQGVKVALVYGGSGELTRRMEKNGLKPELRDGMRVSYEEAMEVCLPAAKQIGDDIASYLGNAETVTPKYAKRLYEWGYGGECLSVDKRETERIIESGGIAVVSFMAEALMPEEGYHGLLNCDADNVARGIASSLNPDDFFLLTDVEGVMKDSQLMKELCHRKARALVSEGYAKNGMKQKVLNAASYAKETGGSAYIFDGTEKGCLTSAIIGEKSGTMIYSPSRNRAEERSAQPK